ncbi:SET domain-containing protein SmydA-8-like isoform X2 [Cylas formicarius]|uniref:SET domain-containing protein SmydA-8-like isoform X2 n=1 Tax=Cylas formicarius TaxID=197179 RepID=UPI0029586233|nr:SET domain-containing protein SmydA-8-like isoform X2 [Cylas formicarius]XP_060522074.1 SET domain-containing protein SmydA-8-like isoform X2 [Cylas formicarius]
MKSRSCRSRSQSIASDLLGEIKEEINAGEPKYELKVSDVMGRYLVAKQDIKPNEVIISEEPLVVGPCNSSKIQCLACYKTLGSKFHRCPGCGWPLCSTNCEGLGKQHGHTKIECTLLEECRSVSYLDYDNAENLSTSFHAIVPLRCLILKTTDPSSFAALMDMESHNEIRRGIPDLWALNQTRVVDKIIRTWKLTEFTEDEIHTICGILEVNAFEIGHQDVQLRGLYPTAFLLSHDCVPNTNHTDQEGTFNLTIRASTAIAEGEPITLSYSYTLQSSQRRREHILENKFFECCCKRCRDPTELRTYLGALICPKCSNGLVLCDNPLNFESASSCTSPRSTCPGYRVPFESVKLLLNRVSHEVEEIDTNDIRSMELFLQKYRNVLHPNHYLCLGIKISLSQLYGRIKGYLIHELSEEQLERKRDLCEEVLKIFNVLEPGYTRIRGVTLYEIHAPVMILLNREIESNSMSKGQIKAVLKKVVDYLSEAQIILKNEPENSAEGIMGRATRDALMQIKEWEKIVGKIR